MLTEWISRDTIGSDKRHNERLHPRLKKYPFWLTETKPGELGLVKVVGAGPESTVLFSPNLH